MRSLVIGWLVVVLVIGWCLVNSGGVGLYFNFPTILVLVLLPAGMSLASFGLGRLRAARRTLRSRVRSPEEASECRAVIRGVIGHVYAAAGIITMICLVQTFSGLMGEARRGEELPAIRCLAFDVMRCLALIWFWCLLIAECVLRPLRNRVGRQDGGKAETNT